jgi:hypothetical protein
MNKIKTILIAIIILLVAGCTSKDHDFNQNYENMIIGNTGINGYSLDLRIYGTLNGSKVNEDVRIKNYNNEDYEITKIDSLNNKETVNYIIDGIRYLKNDNSYTEVSNEINYSNPSAYLEGLKHVNKIDKESEEKIGNKKYTLYNVKVDKTILKDISNDCGFSFSSDKEINADIWLDSDKNVYRIIYYVGDVKINANYYGINNSKSINITRQIELKN